MAYIIACLMAAASFLLNKAALKHIGVDVVITYSPVIEEVAKTLPAYYLGADIAITHVAFGFIEAGYDWRTSGDKKLNAALASILGHSLFGLATIGVLAVTENIFGANIAGILLHFGWNVTMVRLTNRKG